jgi:hypothetical protein
LVPPDGLAAGLEDGLAAPEGLATGLEDVSAAPDGVATGLTRASVAPGVSATVSDGVLQAPAAIATPNVRISISDGFMFLLQCVPSGGRAPIATARSVPSIHYRSRFYFLLSTSYFLLFTYKSRPSSRGCAP